MSSKHMCVLSYAAGRWFPLGQRRLKMSLRTWKIDAEVFAWCDELPPGSPTHADRPYAFKYAALDHARRQGFRLAWWLDSSMVMVNPPHEIMGHWLRSGVFISRFRGYMVGPWTSDEALSVLTLNRADSMLMPMCDANMIGLDFSNPLSHRLLDEMLELVKHPAVFPGDWNNDQQQVSSDSRVLGHRHDQSALSVVGARLGVPFFCFSDLVTRSSLKYRVIEKGSFVCRRGCDEAELTGRVGSLAWRVRQKLRGL